ncbi:type II toxin-antitoxin system VapC family toxin [Janibacter terrae]|uniref:type II toxin-antitoxin system VapC family toxin n=1 Tax=Janibacter terrae TaxID=103817 RepID=UPI0038025D15
MSRWYLDTSAALKLVIEERESSVLADHLDTETPDLVACLLLETELRRAAQRRGDLTQEVVSQLVERVNLFEMPASLFREAGLLGGPRPRSLDALHLAAAVRIGADAVVTYDHRMAEASRDLGFTVIAPT